MPILRIEQPHDDAMLEDWRSVHNTVIPTGPLSLDDVRERSHRNHLEIAYLGDAVVGCSTVRPPTGEDATATVIARVLPAHRGQGYGTRLFTRGMDRAREMGAAVVETVVLASNSAGLRFAEAQGFVEVERYVLPGDTVAYVTLRVP
ncbi:N-acetyltransferase family protein [Actinacidiphila sp. bgisy167]|uniref:GNAT family N-acetyltransferase n=1 Tax=Actinacidiphila sp. bgisy167 TaxID=3413797 RepID=UPI003D7505FD